MLAVLSQRYLLAIQGMEEQNKSGQFVLLVYCGVYPAMRDTCHSHIPPAKNRRRIFIMPVPSKKVFPEGYNSGHGFGLTAGFSGCRD